VKRKIARALRGVANRLDPQPTRIVTLKTDISAADLEAFRRSCRGAMDLGTR
jgi:hypothetical protein